MIHGYFGIGIYQVKSEVNIGTLWRTSFQFGASFIYTIGKRYHKQSSDTPQSIRHVPLYHYTDFEEFCKNIPDGCKLIGVETGGNDILGYSHPERAVYLLGAEDHGLPEDIVLRCRDLITIPFSKIGSLNVSVAGAIVMYDRLTKCSDGKY